MEEGDLVVAHRVLKYLTVALAALTVSVAGAQAPGGVPIGEGARVTGGKDIAAAKIGVDQKIDAQVPLGAPFKDEDGRSVKLGDYFGKRPVLMMLLYYGCKGTCNAGLNGLTALLREFKAGSIGKDFEVVVVSINPKEGPKIATETKRTFMEVYRKPGADAGWHYLTGPQASIESLAKAIGFRYTYNPETGRITHPMALMVETPQGRVSRYFVNVEFGATLVRRAIDAAKNEQLGKPDANARFFGCVMVDPRTGRMTMNVMRTLQVLGIFTVVAVFGSIIVMSVKTKRSEAERAMALGKPPGGLS